MSAAALLPSFGPLATYTVTVGGSGSNWGFAAAFHGSVSPGTFLGGETVTAFLAVGSLFDFRFQITAENNNWFKLTVQDGTGAVRTYARSAATAASGGDLIFHYTWGDGSNPVYVSADNAEVKTVYFFR